jgi:hypothetical protein
MRISLFGLCNRVEEIGRELKIPQITDFMEQYRRNRKQRFGRISTDRIQELFENISLKEISLETLVKGWEKSVVP